MPETKPTAPEPTTPKAPPAEDVKTIVLPRSKATVKLKGFLTWGGRERIKKAIRDGAKVRFDKTGANKFEPQLESYDFDAGTEQTLVALEQLVLEVTPVGGAAQAFDRAWFQELHEDDGNAIVETVNEIRGEGKGSTTSEA